MKDSKEIEFYYYPANVKITKPLGKVSLRDFIRANRNPNKKIQEQFLKIQEATKTGDKRLKAELKSKLFYFNPCVITDGEGRSYSNITKFTGLLVMEFDGVPHAKEFKYWVFENLKSCICAYISPSGYGVKFIISIPVVTTVEEFKSYFYGLGYYFEKYMGFDGSAQNCILPLYLSWDEDLLYREDYETWTIKGEQLQEFKEYEGEIVPLEDVSEDKKEKVLNIFKKGVREIIDNGHPQVRGYSLMLGGYVSGGYLNKNEAEQLAIECIEDNEYLSKGTEGYIKTAKQMINKGMSSPFYLKEDED